MEASPSIELNLSCADGDAITHLMVKLLPKEFGKNVAVQLLLVFWNCYRTAVYGTAINVVLVLLIVLEVQNKIPQLLPLRSFQPFSPLAPLSSVPSCSFRSSPLLLLSPLSVLPSLLSPSSSLLFPLARLFLSTSLVLVVMMKSRELKTKMYSHAHSLILSHAHSLILSHAHSLILSHAHSLILSLVSFLSLSLIFSSLCPLFCTVLMTCMPGCL